VRRLVVVSVIACVGGGACWNEHSFFPTAQPLQAEPELVVSAHQDDDLLFDQPDVLEDVQAGSGVTILYITAGNDRKGVAFVEDRQFGTMNGYGIAVDDSLEDWDCGWLTIADHPAQHCRLDDANLSLVFLGYPDGGIEGQFPGSLLKLWQGEITSGTTVSRQPSGYSQDELIAAVADVIDQTRPQTMRVLDVASTHGQDHTDHMISAALALIALAQSQVSPQHIVSYRGYNTLSEPVTKPDGLLAPQLTSLEAYNACATSCGASCGGLCNTTSTQHQEWASRRYATGFRIGMTGVTISSDDGTGCVAVGEDMMSTLVDCSSAPTWTSTVGGELATAAGSGSAGSVCLEALPTGELVGAPCDPSSDGPADQNHRLYFDDEGHVWAALVPVPVPDMSYQHLDCMVASGGRPRLVLCGQGNAPTWTVARGTSSTTTLGVPATSRPALADVDGDGLADLAYDDGSDLFVAHGHGDGTFGSAARLGPLAINADSLTLGDLDGDGHADACGATASGGTLCSFSRGDYAQPSAFTTTLAVGGAGGDASLTAFGGQLCGAAAVSGAAAVECASGGDAAPQVWSTWPPAGADMWFGGLSGAVGADWCVDDGSGADCGLREEVALTTEGVPWSYSLGGVVDAPPLGPGGTALADIDGDGVADLCGLAGDHVACARGQGHGFGPTLALSPLSAPVDGQLVLGDLDGDGRADACVLPGDGSVTCQLSP
jgi:LmbE family N-acetylglucosaminyl deacetylase